MTQEEALPLIYKAANTLIATKHLALKLDRIEQKPSGIFHIYFTDTKLLAHVYGELGEFSCTIFKDTYEDMNTNGLDLLAKIPDDANDNVKVALRIGYLIFTKFISNFIDVFKKQDVAKNVTINYANARMWYDWLGKR